MRVRRPRSTAPPPDRASQTRLHTALAKYDVSGAWHRWRHRIDTHHSTPAERRARGWWVVAAVALIVVFLLVMSRM